MDEDEKKCATRVIYDYQYQHGSYPEKEGDEWLTVYVPYIGTYGAIDIVIQDHLHNVYDDDIRTFVLNNESYEEINIVYTVSLDDYNKEYIDLVKDLLSLSELHFVTMLSPREYNFETDRLKAQITKNDMWKLYEGVKDTTYYAQEVKDAISYSSGYIPYFRKEDFYFNTKNDLYSSCSPAILHLIMKAALHEALEMDDSGGEVEMELFLQKEDKKSILTHIEIKSIKAYKEEKEIEVEF